MAASYDAKKKTNGRSLNPSLTRSYGAADSKSRAQESRELVKHDVCPGETLAGLALRYGVTVEEIRQENKLWANDSLFLRPQLYISVKKGFKQPVQEDDSRSQTVACLVNDELNVDDVGGQGKSPSQGHDGQGLDKSSVSNLFASFDAQLDQFRSNASHLGTSRPHLSSLTAPLTADCSASKSHQSACAEDKTAELAGISPKTLRHIQASQSLQGFIGRKARKRQEQDQHTEELFEL